MSKELFTRAGTLKRLHYLILSLILIGVTGFIDAQPLIKGVTVAASIFIIVLELFALYLAYNSIKQDKINSSHQE